MLPFAPSQRLQHGGTDASALKTNRQNHKPRTKSEAAAASIRHAMATGKLTGSRPIFNNRKSASAIEHQGNADFGI